MRRILENAIAAVTCPVALAVLALFFVLAHLAEWVGNVRRQTSTVRRGDV